MGDPRLPLREKVLGFPPWEYLVLASFGFLVTVWIGGTLAVALFYIVSIAIGFVLTGGAPVLGLELSFEWQQITTWFIEQSGAFEVVFWGSTIASLVIAIHAVLGYALDALDWVLRKVRSPG